MSPKHDLVCFAENIEITIWTERNMRRHVCVSTRAEEWRLDSVGCPVAGIWSFFFTGSDWLFYDGFLSLFAAINLHSLLVEKVNKTVLLYFRNFECQIATFIDGCFRSNMRSSSSHCWLQHCIFRAVSFLVPYQCRTKCNSHTHPSLWLVFRWKVYYFRNIRNLRLCLFSAREYHRGQLNKNCNRKLCRNE